jgi:hypothetical protein
MISEMELTGANNPILVREWDVDTFHERVRELEAEGYVARRETYRIVPEMNPETGEIVHLHSMEMDQPSPDES